MRLPAPGAALSGLLLALVATSPRPSSGSNSSCLATVARANVSLGGWDLSVEPHEDIAVGANSSVPCRAVHGGYEGLVALRCSGAGALAADASACFRVGCPQPRHFLRRSGGVEAAPIQADGAPEGATCRWAAFALAGGGRLLAAPCSAESALEVDPSGNVRGLAGSFAGALKYRTTVGVLGRPVAYGLPFYASSVLRLDADSGAASALGAPFGPGGSKWLGGARAAGKVLGMPYNHPHVLRIDVLTDSVTTIGPDLSAFSSQGVAKWWEAVAVGDRVLGIPCAATALLLVDAATESVTTFGGPFNATTKKWHGAVVIPGTDLVYAMPHDASRVLKVDVANAQAELIGPDFGLDPGKWNSAVLASDGSIFAVPASASQVLRIDPRLDSVTTIGQVLAGENKWLHSVLMPSGHVLGIPGDHRALLLVDPSIESVTLLESSASQAGGRLGKWSGASLGQDGAAYAAPAAAGAVLRVSEGACVPAPRPVDEVCTMGEPCNLTLAGPHVQGGADTLWVATGRCTREPLPLAAFRGWTNPRVAEEPAPEVACFALGVAVAGEPLAAGAYRLCWSESSARPSHDVGWLTVLGPPPTNATCTLGQPCVLEIQGGRGLLPTDEVALLLPSAASAGERWPRISGMANPANATAPGLHPLGTPLAGAPGSYALFWGRGRREAWPVELGALLLQGPTPIANVSCTMGLPCSLTLQGIGLQPGDRVALRRLPLGCQDGLGDQSHGSGVRGWCDEDLGWCTPSLVTSNGGESTYALGAATAFPDEGSPPAFAVCWEGAGGAAEPREEQRGFAVRMGLVELRGPVVAAAPGPLVVCKLGLACNLTLSGYGLRSSDRLAVVAGGACPASGGAWGAGGAGALANIGFAANPALAASLIAVNSSDVLAFELGVAESGAPGRYRLCWQVSSTLAVDAGTVEVGLLDLEENNCAAPSVPFAAEPSCQEGLSVPHGGRCTPGCAPLADLESPAVLQCRGGELAPAGYRCLRRCLTPPMVARGGEQAHCTTRLSGDVCEVRCPAGHVKSGDLVCRDSRYEHRSNPSLPSSLQWAVPRCYRPCSSTALNVSNAGLPCAGASEVLHGGTCQATCSIGFAAFDSTGTSLLSGLRCRDGAFQPSTYTCLRTCQAPSIPHSVDLHECDGTNHGTTCELRCEPFHRKTGDLHCTNGVFSPAACLRPCNASALWPNGLPHGPAVPCVGLGPEGLLRHGATCRPACNAGLSNVVEAEQPVCRDGSLLLPNGSSAAGVRCYEDCPGRPPQGLVPYALDLGDACSDLKHGQECPLLCEDGAEADGGIRCVNGSYGGGACLQWCLLPVVQHTRGLDHCHHTQHGENCSFECQENYMKVGELACMYGSWQRLDLCKAPCAASDAIEATGHAAAVRCAEGELVTHGGTCTYQCVGGYATATTASCHDGALRPPAFECELVLRHACGPPKPPGVPPALWEECKSMAHGDVCRFSSCLPGYAKSLPLRCVFGNWSADACIDMRPRCKATPPYVVNGATSATCSGSLAGSWCPVTCDPGYQHGLGMGFTCMESGAWTGIANCVPSACGRPLPTAHADVTCNGVAAADRCQVDCHRGYGSDGELVCLRNVSTGAWAWRAMSDTPGTALCEPSPCGVAPFVPGILTHSCSGLPHGGTCLAFVCQDGLAQDGLYRCFAGGFADVPVCLASSHGFVSTLAVTFRLEVRVTAYWGDLQITTNWGQLGARLAKAALHRSLASQPVGEVLLLAWSSRSTLSENRSSGESAGARRLPVGVIVEYLAAVLPEAAAGASSAAMILASRLTALTPAGLSTQVVGEPGPISAEGEADLEFTAIGPPSLRRVPRPAPAPPPTPAPLPVTTTTALTTPNATATDPPVAAAEEDDVQAFFRSHGVVAGITTVLVLGACCACGCARYRNHKLMLKLRDLPRRTRLKKLSLIQNAPRPSTEVDNTQLHALAALDAAVRVETQANSATKLMRTLNDEYAAEERRRFSIESIDEKGTHGRRRNSLASLVDMYQSQKLDAEADPDLDEATLNILNKSREVVAMRKQHDREKDEVRRAMMRRQGMSMWNQVRLEDVNYLMRSQADYEPGNDLPDDWLEAGRREREKAAAAKQKAVAARVSAGTAARRAGAVAGMAWQGRPPEYIPPNRTNQNPGQSARSGQHEEPQPSVQQSRSPGQSARSSRSSSSGKKGQKESGRPGRSPGHSARSSNHSSGSGRKGQKEQEKDSSAGSRGKPNRGGSPRGLSGIKEGSEEGKDANSGRSPSVGQQSAHSNATPSSGQHEGSEPPMSGRSAWTRQVSEEESLPQGARAGGDQPEEPIRIARRGSLSMEAAVVTSVSLKRVQGLTPERKSKLNRNTLQNCGRSSCHVSKNEPTRRNFQHRVRGMEDFYTEEADPLSELAGAKA